MTVDNPYFCRNCDSYRGYKCAEHREPSYEELVNKVADLERMCELHLQTIRHNAEFRQNDQRELAELRIKVGVIEVWSNDREKELHNIQFWDVVKQRDSLQHEKNALIQKCEELEASCSKMHDLAYERGEVIARLESENNALAAQLHEQFPAVPISDEEIDKLVSAAAQESVVAVHGQPR